MAVVHDDTADVGAAESGACTGESCVSACVAVLQSMRSGIRVAVLSAQSYGSTYHIMS